MNTKSTKRPFLNLLLLAFATYQAAALAETTFLEGGYAEICELAAQTPDSGTGYRVTGSNLTLSGEEICTRAIERRDAAGRNTAQSYNNRGVLYFAREAYDLALADFDSAISEDDSLGQAYLNRGLTLVALERWSAALEAFRSGQDRGAEMTAEVYFSRAIASEESGDITQAYRDYLEASKLKPGWDKPRLELERFSVREAAGNR